MTELVDGVVAPYLLHVDEEKEEAVAAAGLDCLVGILSECQGDSHQRCLDLIGPFERVLTRALANADPGKYT